eukprot:c275_g1_i1.p1 GENE.c275_g1_i1~~c275_g1_i1.p1  ORF type:complete len:438 (+),score=111.90 c275_g1_i1:120-1316(+)
MTDVAAMQDEGGDDQTDEEGLHLEQLRQEGIVQVQRVADQVSHLTNDITDLQRIIAQSQSQSMQSEPSQMVDALTKLKARCRGFNELLIKELTNLDSIDSHGEEEVRALRKRQVGTIQQLMGLLDATDGQLTEMLKEAKVKAEKERAEQERAREAEEQEHRKHQQQDRQQQRVQQDKQSQPEEEEESAQMEDEGASLQVHPQVPYAQPQQPSPVEFLCSAQAKRTIWPRLVLEPQFSVSESTHAYELVAMIPGMKMKDITISLDRNQLVISGLRLPSEAEVAHLNKLVVSRVGRMLPPPEQQAQLILRLAAGTFGAFKKSFLVPEDANAEGVQATYKGGVLKIEIPKISIPAYSPRGVNLTPMSRLQGAVDPFASLYGFPSRVQQPAGPFRDTPSFFW